MPMNALQRLYARADRDTEFRERLIGSPRHAIEEELGQKLAEDHEVHVHEDTDSSTHLVIPPRSQLSEEEREEARTGAVSLEFLKRTMHDPAPPKRESTRSQRSALIGTHAPEAMAKAAGAGIRLGLGFAESSLDQRGAWHCIRYNVARPEVPRHFERPPFISALCMLALEACDEPRARAMVAATRAFLASAMEHPGLWRYYLHLPQDLDSTALCSLAIGGHPWIALERNVSEILANRDEQGRFKTWVLSVDEPDVVATFRIEADPVVNANVVAYLGDRPETKEAQRWLESLISEDQVAGKSKWYPDSMATYYATARAMVRARPAMRELRALLVDRILGLRNAQGEFGDILQAAQAVTALHWLDKPDVVDFRPVLDELLSTQRDDGSWPELLAFGDQELRWGTVGQIGHGAESVTSAFCVEALAHLKKSLSR